MIDPASKNMEKQLKKTSCHAPLPTSEYTHIHCIHKKMHVNIKMTGHSDMSIISTVGRIRQEDCFDFKASLMTQ